MELEIQQYILVYVKVYLASIAPNGSTTSNNNYLANGSSSSSDISTSSPSIATSRSLE